MDIGGHNTVTSVLYSNPLRRLQLKFCRNRWFIPLHIGAHVPSWQKCIPRNSREGTPHEVDVRVLLTPSRGGMKNVHSYGHRGTYWISSPIPTAGGHQSRKFDRYLRISSFRGFPKEWCPWKCQSRKSPGSSAYDRDLPQRNLGGWEHPVGESYDETPKK